MSKQKKNYNFGREETFRFQVVIIATSNTPLNIIIQYMYIYQIQTLSVLHIALVRIYIQIFTALKLSLSENTKKTQNNLKIVIIKNSKTLFCGLSNCLVTANKEPDNRNNCLLGVDRIGD